MDESRLAAALTGLVGPKLAAELSADLVKIRRDYATQTLERTTPGKFVETFVQCLQYIDSGFYDQIPGVDKYLANKVENTSLPDGLRVCAARVARSMYTLRNKRNIAHKNEVDVNSHDLAFVHHGASWICAELLRQASGVSMEEAGSLIELVQTPVGTLVEEIDGTRLVHADVSVRVEVLILLHSFYPEKVPVRVVIEGLSRRNHRTVRNCLRFLYEKKLTHGGVQIGYRLTKAGFEEAVAEIIALER